MSRLPFPGHDAPEASFESPFAMLAACHHRMRRSGALLTRLVEHLRQPAPGAMAADAARDVLRYFDLAAPAHHLDEERHVFPTLAADAALAPVIQQLLAEHRQLDAQWCALRVLLVPVAEGRFQPSTLPGLQAASREFLTLNEGHLALEDCLVLPAAEALSSADQRLVMGTEMAARRGLGPRSG